jgi:hypothetical protein
MVFIAAKRVPGVTHEPYVAAPIIVRNTAGLSGEFNYMQMGVHSLSEAHFQNSPFNHTLLEDLGHRGDRQDGPSTLVIALHDVVQMPRCRPDASKSAFVCALRDR